MVFTPRLFEDFLRDEINFAIAQNSIFTDFNPGSGVRTILEAGADSAETISRQSVEMAQSAVNLAGYAPFIFGPKGPQAASGILTLTTTAGMTLNVTLAKNTGFTIIGTSLIYASTDDVTIPANGGISTTIQVPVQCLSLGVIGNTAQGTIKAWASPSLAVISNITNIYAFTNGANAETLDQTRARFATFINGLQRGTLQAINYGALTSSVINQGVTEQVAKAISWDYQSTLTLSSEYQIPLGYVQTYIFNGVGLTFGQPTSPALVASTQQIIDGYVTNTGLIVPGYVSAGIISQVFRVVEYVMNIQVKVIAVLPGFTVAMIAGNIEQQIRNYITSLQIGQTMVWSALISAISQTLGLGDYSIIVTFQVGNYTTPSSPAPITPTTSPLSYTNGNNFITPPHGVIIVGENNGSTTGVTVINAT